MLSERIMREMYVASYKNIQSIQSQKQLFCVSTLNENANSSLQSFVFLNSSSMCLKSVFKKIFTCFFMSGNVIFDDRNFTT